LILVVCSSDLFFFFFFFRFEGDEPIKLKDTSI